MTSTREKGRAIFLAAIMVMSMVAMSAAFVGPAAADVNEDTTTAEDVTVGLETVEQEVILNTSSDDNVTVDIQEALGNDFDFESAEMNGSSSNATLEDDNLINVSTGSENNEQSLNITYNTSIASTGDIDYTVTDIGDDDSATVSFTAVGASDVTADNIDVTQDEESVFVNVTHTDNAENVNLTMVSDVDDISVSDNNDSVEITEPENNLTEFEVNLSSDSGGDALPIGDWDLYAAASNDTSPFGAVDATNNQVSSAVTVDGLQVIDSEGPRVAANDIEVSYDVTIENTGDEEVTQDVEIAPSGNLTGSADSLDLQNTSDRLGTEEVTIGAGENDTVEVTFNTGDLDGASDNIADYEVAAFTDGSPFSAGDVSDLKVGSGSDGSIAITVSDDLQPDQGETTDVALYTFEDFDDENEPFEVTETDEDGEANFRDLAVGPSDDESAVYVAEAAFDDPNFESTTTQLELFEPTQTSTSDTLFITRVVDADRLTIDSFDPADTVQTGESLDINTLVETLDEPTVGEFGPLEDGNVEVTDIETVSGPATIDGINVGDDQLSDEDGIATFEDVTTSEDFEDVEEDTVFEITFEATEAGDSDEEDITATATVTFEAEPPTGDGVIQGDVSEIDEDVDLGVQNAEKRGGVNVHAVEENRLADNSEFFDYLDDEEEESVRVVEWNASADPGDQVVDLLDVETDYLFKNQDNVTVTQNFSIEGTGFDVAGNGDDTEFSVHVLDPQEELPEDHTYAVQNSTDGNFTGEGAVPVDTPHNLTFDGTADRFSEVSAYPTDVTNDDGSYNLQGLFTDGEESLDYVVIAGDGNSNLGFANGQAYDSVTVHQSADATDAQLDTPLNVQQVDVQADSVDLTNLGTHPSLAETGGEPDFDAIEEFEDQSAEHRQEIPRDGETLDVINLETFVEEDDITLGDEVTVSYDVDAGDSFNGEFANLSVGGDVIDRGANNETITVDTSAVADGAGDGEAFVFLQTDQPGLDEDANVTINAEMENAAGEDFSDKLFFGILEQDYLSGSITGVVTDDDDNPVDARVFVEELTDTQTGIEITFEPDSVDDLENFTATVFDDDGDVIETVDLTADEMREFTFQGFDSDLELAEGEEPYELLADRADDRTTLSPVPALEADDDADRVSYALTGVSETGQTGTSVSTPVEVDRTSTASIVIEGVDQAFFQVSDLDPDEFDAEADEEFTVNATVTNVGDLPAEKDIEFRIDGETEETVSADLAAGDDTPVQFDVDAGELDAGNYTYSVWTEDDEATGELTVAEEDGDENGDGPSLSDYQLEDGTTTTELLREAIADWRAEDIRTDLLRDVISNWRATN